MLSTIKIKKTQQQMAERSPAPGQLAPWISKNSASSGAARRTPAWTGRVALLLESVQRPAAGATAKEAG